MKNDRVPIVNFLDKHKWRIVLPLLFALLYWSIPRYQVAMVAVQQTLFVKSAGKTEGEVRESVASAHDKVLSDQSLAALISKYDLFPAEQQETVKIQKLKRSIEYSVESEDVVDGAAVTIWTHLRKDDGAHIAEISDDLAAPIAAIDGVHIEKFVSRPYDASPYKGTVFLGGLLQGLVLLVIPLILLWELPNLVYSPKTRETVFDPLLADWHDELVEAKLAGNVFKAVEINIKYTAAYFSAMLQRSPVGDAVELVKKIAS